ncbi:helix-turn-helix domain-containing protein [Streptomyces boncukensis]|uniref:Helix-turn-helix domain-containing protein n=1 Tax=Streptomyces boncukensis TaxID=2711219 RepID=A0A6G4WYB4_9ACTN|nr:helix-turn-helix transcriptional regulator [Streptomyces boncukensis]NGO69993.1 helix-turn-helix domain-containing protein [Streptomyces boncukensis]
MAERPRNSQQPLSRRYLGDQFKRWRIEAGLSREEIAETVNCSVDTVKAVEQGRRPLSPRAATMTDEMVGANGKLKAGLNYQEDNRFPERSHDYFGYETDARVLHWYEVALIPGLLQTEEYMRALISDRYPPLDEGTAEERVQARLKRQEILHRKPAVALHFVVYEAALRCPVGGPKVHRDQLLHLLDLMRERRISLQVLPFTSAISAALNGPMVLLEDQSHDHFALTEGQSLTQFTTDAEIVSELTVRYGRIRQEALSTEETSRFIERMVKEL